MQTEFELKFLGVDHDDLQTKITNLGGVMRSPMTMMKRVVFDLPGDGEFIRVRDEGDGQITMTFKSMKSRAIDGTKEINVVVDDFDNTVALLKAGGLVAHSHQESYRMIYELDGCEICFDRWPGINPYIEIEGPTQQGVEDLIKRLGLNVDEGFGGTVNAIYEKELGFAPGDIEKIAELTFANPPQSRF